MHTNDNNETTQGTNHEQGDDLVVDGTSTLAAEFMEMPKAEGELFSLLPDSIPDQQVVLDQAIAILRCLRGRSPEGALALANEVMGY